MYTHIHTIRMYTHTHTVIYIHVRICTCLHTYTYIYTHRNMFIAKWFILAKNIGDKVNAHQLENGGIKNGIFPP